MASWRPSRRALLHRLRLREEDQASAAYAVRLVKEQHVDYDWMNMDIIGIDGTRRKIDFTVAAGEPHSYVEGLYASHPHITPPSRTVCSSIAVKDALAG